MLTAPTTHRFVMDNIARVEKADIKFTAVLPLYQANLVFGAEFTPTSDSSCN